MAKLNKNLKTLARQAGGSFKTVADRMKIADRFAARLQSLIFRLGTLKILKQGMLNYMFAAVLRKTYQNAPCKMKCPPFVLCYVLREKRLWPIRLTKN